MTGLSAVMSAWIFFSRTGSDKRNRVNEKSETGVACKESGLLNYQTSFLLDNIPSVTSEVS